MCLPLVFLSCGQSQGTATAVLSTQDILLDTSSYMATKLTEDQANDSINRRDADGRKNGLWKDTSSTFIYERYYRHGHLSGPYIQYFRKDGLLAVLGEYKDNERCGTWYCFRKSGHLWMKLINFAKNTDITAKEHACNPKMNYNTFPDYRCYSYYYYMNGGVESEGAMMWRKGNDPMSDSSIQYGEWKYYDTIGTLVGKKIMNTYHVLGVQGTLLYTSLYKTTDSTDGCPLHKTTALYHNYAYRILQNNSINQRDADGRKNGLWIDTTNYSIDETYYRHGCYSGVGKYYNANGRLLTFGEYKNNEYSGTWYYFFRSGHLVMKFSNFEKNTDIITREHARNPKMNHNAFPDYRCHFTDYYLSGVIKSEGTLIWRKGDNPAGDLSMEYGEWKYYDPNGILVRTKDYEYQP